MCNSPPTRIVVMSMEDIKQPPDFLMLNICEVNADHIVRFVLFFYVSGVCFSAFLYLIKLNYIKFSFIFFLNL